MGFGITHPAHPLNPLNPMSPWHVSKMRAKPAESRSSYRYSFSPPADNTQPPSRNAERNANWLLPLILIAIVTATVLMAWPERHK